MDLSYKCNCHINYGHERRSYGIQNAFFFFLVNCTCMLQIYRFVEFFLILQLIPLFNSFHISHAVLIMIVSYLFLRPASYSFLKVKKLILVFSNFFFIKLRKENNFLKFNYENKFYTYNFIHILIYIKQIRNYLCSIKK